MKKSVFTTILLVLSAVVVFGGLGYCIYYRFTHPKLTETELFIELWEVETIMVVVFVLGEMLAKRLK